MSQEEAILRCPICKEAVPEGYILCPFCGADLTAQYKEQLYPPVKLKDVWTRMKGLVLEPQFTFEEVSHNPDLLGALFFILAIALCFSLQIIALLIHIKVLKWGTSILLLLLLWVFLLALPAISWWLGSAIIYQLVKLLGGKVSKKQIRGIVGYSLFPVLTGELLNAVLYLVALPWREPNTIYYEETFSALRDLRNSFIGITALVINLLSLVAFGCYLAFFLKRASKFSWPETIFSVSLPLLTFIALLITYYFVA